MGIGGMADKLTNHHVMKTAIIAITSTGAERARRLAGALPDTDLYLPERFRSGSDSCDFDAPLRELLPRLFAEYTGLICIMATGIVVRLLAPYLRGKQYDPAVVVVDEKGLFAISLLSGHLGGANQLARQTAEILGGEAVITTATDVNDLPAWDEVARIYGLIVEPVTHIKYFNRHLLEGGTTALVDPQRRICDHFERVPGVACFETFLDAETAEVENRVYVTHRLVPDLEQQSNLLLLRPRDLVVGLGCNRGTTADEIEAVVTEVLGRAQLSAASLCALATIADKREEAGIHQFARHRGLPVRYYTAEELNEVEVPSPPSIHALHAVGAKGVCEPAALLTATPGRLLVRKQRCGNVTVAVAEKQFLSHKTAVSCKKNMNILIR